MGTGLAAVGRTMLVAVPIVLVFAGLLAAADPMFSELLGDAFDAFGVDLWGSMLSRTLTISGAALAMAGLLSFALRRRMPLPEQSAVPQHLTMRTTATVFAMISLLFVAFGLVQARFLFSGDHGQLPHGLTYAGYAHQGFFQLVAVVALTLLLILSLGRWTRLETAAHGTAFKALGTVLVACTMPLWASAVERMVIYQDAYGATVLRLFVFAFLCATGLLLGYRAVSLWWKPQWFGGGALALSLLSAVALNLVNPDAYIAEHNLNRPSDVVVLDTWYLTQLSADAVPAVERGTIGMDPERRDEILRALRVRAENRSSKNPAAFNVARARALSP
jgi:MprA protease rhombosortase-interaction domain-containing protein